MATMNTEKEHKVTKRDKFNDIKALLTGNPTTYITVDEALTFLDSELAILEKKNKSRSKKSVEAEMENDGYKNMILDFLESRLPDRTGLSCTVIGRSIPALADPDKGFGTSKYSKLCWSLLEEGRLVRTIGKAGAVLWSLPEVTDTDEETA